MRTASEMPGIRPAAVAGSFYPAEPERLRAQVGEFLAAVPRYSAAPKALIAPHAGYVYSGRVAAAAFASVRGRAETVERVVLIGPAHYVRLRGIAAPTAAAFETPLGRVAVDQEALAALGDLPFVTEADAPHAPEHALEVELPFLQQVLSSFALVPLVVGEATAREVAELLARLWGGPDTLVVVSSDLSHYLGYRQAQRLDLETAAAIERRDAATLGPHRACGFLPIAGLLIEAERRGLKVRRLALCNSGDTAGDRASVVGYGAWAFEAEEE